MEKLSLVGVSLPRSNRFAKSRRAMRAMRDVDHALVRVTTDDEPGPSSASERQSGWVPGGSRARLARSSVNTEIEADAKG
jgi:hypothetical protein